MTFKIKDREIGGKKVFIIAELSGNHNHDFNRAVKSLKAMKEAGADAVKLQTYTADTLTIDCSNKYFQIKGGTLWDGKTLYELYKEAYTPWDWHPKLQKVAKELGLIFFSTPFDRTAVDFLEKLDVPAFKVASFEANDTPLIEYIASKKKPVIISTGISTLNEITDALKACKNQGNEKIALLKCTSAYPAPFNEVNLDTIPNMAKRFKKIIGLSDHTLGISVPVAAVALGAKVVEKHFILDRKLGGPDAEFSLEPYEFKSMVKSIREVEEAIGKATYELSPKILKSRKFQRSLFTVADISKGEKFTENNIRSIRPGFGLSPKHFYDIIGMTAKQNIKRGTPLIWKLIDKI
ncbi:MAG: pseudaminic acid synthase [Patescibacteria group bacterium]|jgi:pseudaminic acid synthase